MAQSPRPVLHPVPEQLHPFDVYRMPVRFEDDPNRTRNHYVACVVIAADGEGGLAVKLTSNPKWNDVGDVHLADWEQAGLVHATTARCAQLVRFRREDLQGRTGTLSVGDADMIVSALLSVPRDRLVWL